VHALVNGSKAQVAVIPSPFERLQAQARRLQWLTVCLVGSVAVVPALVYFTLALSNLRLDTERHARHLVPMIAASVFGSDLDRETVSALIRKEIAFNNLAGVRLLDAAGGEILRLGRGDPTFSATEVAIHLPASTGPVRELRVTPDDRALLDRAARVLGLHLLVAAVLGALVYRVPLRALWHAIDEVERTQAQLVHSDRLSSIGEMYAGLAHEINNPLGIILTRVRFLLATAAERQFPPDLVQDFEVIDRHGSRIAETIRGLLAFARRTEFEFAPTDVNGVIGEAVALVESLFARQGIRVQLVLDRSLPRVRASAQHLQQVFLNLVNNAHDAMPDGGTITVRTYRGGSRLVAEVRDTGRGIPPEIQPRVFEPFFTTKDVGKGTGLGLAVSYGIVRAHGGDLTVESRQGDGAVFRVVLPGEATR